MKNKSNRWECRNKECRHEFTSKRKDGGICPECKYQEEKPYKINGALDWRKKLEAIKLILGAGSYDDLLREVLREVVPPDKLPSHINESARRALGKSGHHNSNNDTVMLFWKTLPSVLKCDNGITGEFLKEAGFDQFLKYLPNASRERVTEVVSHPSPSPKVIAPIVKKPPKPSSRTSFFNVLIHNNLRISSNAPPPYDKQKYCYLNPNAAENWNELIGTSTYTSYKYCLISLISLFNQDLWEEKIKEGSYNGVVSLTGGGAPAKDAELIQSLCSLRENTTEQTLYYHIVDISIYMLMASIDHLNTVTKIQKKCGHQVELIPVLADVTEDRINQSFFKGDNRIFLITGGTLGNLSEKAFFQSLNGMSKVKDLLILSVDTFDNTNPMNESKLLTNYNPNINIQMKEIITPIVHAIRNQYDIPLQLKDIIAQVKVKLSELSDIKGSKSLELSLEWEDEEIGLVKSTRYISSNLVKFAEENGWTHLYTHPCDLNTQFVQMLFIRNEE